MKTFTKYTAIFSGVGLLVPLIFRAVWHYLNQYANIKVQMFVEKLMLLLWPTSIMALPASPDPSFEAKLFFISLGANILFYAILGTLIGLGLRKHISFLVVAFLLVAVVWWLLLTL